MSCIASGSNRIVREKSAVLSNTRYTVTSARCDWATKMAFISVCARISVWASLPTDASSFWLSVGAARALSTKVRIGVQGEKGRGVASVARVSEAHPGWGDLPGCGLQPYPGYMDLSGMHGLLETHPPAACSPAGDASQARGV